MTHWSRLSPSIPSSIICVTAIVMDALCALPRGVEQQVPSSLRCTSIVLVACLASPILSTGFAFEQRGLFLLGLVIASLRGEHHGNANVRAADALFILVSGCVIVYLYKINVKQSSTAKPEKSTSNYSLTGSLITYVGLRVVRNAICHAGEVYQYVVHDYDFETRGYGLADGVFVFTATFGGAMLVCTGVFVILHSQEMESSISSAVRCTIATNTTVIFASTLIAQLSTHAHAEYLTMIFSKASCIGPQQHCAAAYRARSHYVSNSSTAALWIGGIAAAVLVMPKSRDAEEGAERPARRRQGHDTQCTTSTSAVVSIVVTFLLTTGILIDAVESSSVIPQLQLVLLLSSIPVAKYGTPELACVLNVSGHVIYIRQRLSQSTGFDLSYFTHWSLLGTTCVVAVLGILTLVERVLPYWSSTRKTTGMLSCVTVTLIVVAMSLQFALGMATFSLTAGYDGCPLLNVEAWRINGYEHTFQHSVTFPFTLALYTSRSDVYDTHTIKRIAWYSAPTALAVCWGLLLLLDVNRTYPYVQSNEPWGFGISLLSAVLSWIVTGMSV